MQCDFVLVIRRIETSQRARAWAWLGVSAESEAVLALPNSSPNNDHVAMFGPRTVLEHSTGIFSNSPRAL